jgi:hypothetical protein
MALSGQKTVMTAGTAEALGSQRICAPYMLKALTTNTSLATSATTAPAMSPPIFQSSNLPTFKRANVPMSTAAQPSTALEP